MNDRGSYTGQKKSPGENVVIIKDKSGDNIIAIIIYSAHTAEGIQFFTPNDFSQQLAFMSHKKGAKIQPHIHNEIERKIVRTQEVLIIKKGKIKVNFFDSERKLLQSEILQKGDTILLASGGHGFEILEDLEMIEIKQGPYLGEKDKIRF